MREKTESIIKDEQGSIMIEAAIYFPMIIIVVLLMVMVSLYKLDKIMTQANLSVKANKMQLEMDQEEMYTYRYGQYMGNNSDLDDKRILKAQASSSRVYQWLDECTVYPIVEVDYSTTYNMDFFGLMPQSTSHTFLVKHNPMKVSGTLRDVSLFREDMQGRIGMNFDTYMKIQYGY